MPVRPFRQGLRVSEMGGWDTRDAAGKNRTRAVAARRLGVALAEPPPAAYAGSEAMATFEQRERWRGQLTSTDPVVVVNAIPIVGASGDPEMLTPLERAGERLPASFWEIKIALPDGDVTVREYHRRAVDQLRSSMPYAAAVAGTEDAAVHVFLSYSTLDRARANRLALALTEQPTLKVFLDHWALAPGDRLLERLENAIDEAGVVLALLSEHSVRAPWVLMELEQAAEKALAEASFRLIPVLLEDCELPQVLGDIVFVDWREESRIEYAVQSIVERLMNRTSFSQRVRDFLMAPGEQSPYDDVISARGRQLLGDLASAPELAVDANQQWLLWELFHRFLDAYRCTLKITKAGPDGGARFQFLDRWSETAQELTLSREALEGGLWRFVVDLSQSGQWTEADAERLGDTGRLVFSRRARPDVNPAPSAAASAAEGVLARLVQAAQEHDDAARQSMVFDLQRLVAPSSWHTIEIVVGAAWEHNLASSPMLRDTPSGRGEAVLFELWDPFLGALKHTAVHLSLLPHVWACDLDLLAGTQEHYLGLD